MKFDFNVEQLGFVISDVSMRLEGSLEGYCNGQMCVDGSLLRYLLEFYGHADILLVLGLVGQNDFMALLQRLVGYRAFGAITIM